MIYSVEGSLVGLKKYDGFCLAAVKCESGVSFSLKVSFKTAQEIEGRTEVFLYTELILRENLAELFGFFSEFEKEAFKILIGISGVGPSFAISILSFLSPYELFKAVSMKDCDRLCGCKGIGKKTANRIILELKDKVKSFGIEKVKNFSNKETDKDVFVKEAVEALVVLGYKKSDALDAVMLQKEKKGVESLIKDALLILSEK